jgi:hypothetical protein
MLHLSSPFSPEPHSERLFLNWWIAPKAPSSFCTQFFKSRTSNDAKLCFTNSMQKEFNCHVNTDNSVITNIYNGQFLREYVDVPSDFSAFAFPKHKWNTWYEAWDDYNETQSYSWQRPQWCRYQISPQTEHNPSKQHWRSPFLHHSSHCSLQTLLHQTIHSSLLPPWHLSPHRKVQTHLRCLSSCWWIFLSKIDLQSWFLNLCLAHWMFWLQRQRTHQWLSNPLPFNPNLCHDKWFHQDLPSSIFKIKNKFFLSLNNAIESNSPSTSKKHKQGKEQQDDLVQNECTIQDWLINNKIHDSKLKGNKVALAARPCINGTAICHCFHSKGKLPKQRYSHCQHLSFWQSQIQLIVFSQIAFWLTILARTFKLLALHPNASRYEWYWSGTYFEVLSGKTSTPLICLIQQSTSNLNLVHNFLILFLLNTNDYFVSDYFVP